MNPTSKYYKRVSYPENKPEKDGYYTVFNSLFPTSRTAYYLDGYFYEANEKADGWNKNRKLFNIGGYFKPVEEIIVCRRCHCSPEQTTGTTQVHCCNVCGFPSEDFWIPVAKIDNWTPVAQTGNPTGNILKSPIKIVDDLVNAPFKDKADYDKQQTGDIPNDVFDIAIDIFGNDDTISSTFKRAGFVRGYLYWKEAIKQNDKEIKMLERNCSRAQDLVEALCTAIEMPSDKEIRDQISKQGTYESASDCFDIATWMRDEIIKRNSKIK